MFQELSFADAAHKHKRVPTAVTIKENIMVLNVHSNRKNVSHGFFAGVFRTLDRFGIVVDLISTSEVHVSMAIEDNVNKKLLNRILQELKKSGSVSFTFNSSTDPTVATHDVAYQVSVHTNMCILSLVGKLQHMVGIAGRMFSTLADGDVNIHMISQGSSEINISCVIDGRDAVKALNLIHQSCLQIKPEGAMGRSELSRWYLNGKKKSQLIWLSIQWALGYSEGRVKHHKKPD